MGTQARRTSPTAVRARVLQGSTPVGRTHGWAGCTQWREELSRGGGDVGHRMDKKRSQNSGSTGKSNLPAPVTSATLPSSEADARPRGPGMALYLPFFEGAGPSWNSSVIACLPFSTFAPFAPLIGRGVSSVKPGAMFVIKLCVVKENLVQGVAEQDSSARAFFGYLSRKVEWCCSDAQIARS